MVEENGAFEARRSGCPINSYRQRQRVAGLHVTRAGEVDLWQGRGLPAQRKEQETYDGQDARASTRLDAVKSQPTLPDSVSSRLVPENG